MSHWSTRSHFSNPSWVLDMEDRIRPVKDADDSSYYFEAMKAILSAPPAIGVPPDPTMLVPGVYLGTQQNAENLRLLKKMKITLVFNCAGDDSDSLRASRARKYREVGVGYDELPLADSPYEQIRKYLERAYQSIEKGRMAGKVLIHCGTGVSRSGAIAIGYLIRGGRKLLQATKALKEDRRCVLCNENFMKTLVDYAQSLGMLDPQPERIHAPRYGRRIDSYRINSAHLPLHV